MNLSHRAGNLGRVSPNITQHTLKVGQKFLLGLLVKVFSYISSFRPLLKKDKEELALQRYREYLSGLRNISIFLVDIWFKKIYCMTLK